MAPKYKNTSKNMGPKAEIGYEFKLGHSRQTFVVRILVPPLPSCVTFREMA